VVEKPVAFRRNWSWKIVIARREILGKNERIGKGVSVVGQIIEQPPDADEGGTAGLVGERWILLSQASKPAQNMRVSLQLSGSVKVGVVSVEVAQKAVGVDSVVFNGSRSQGGSHDLELFFKDWMELAELHCAHRASGSSRWWRLCTER
jgi:hypothetical protein